MIVIPKHDHTTLFRSSKTLITLARALLVDKDDTESLNSIKEQLKTFDALLMSCIEKGASERLIAKATGKRAQFRDNVSQCLRAVLSGSDDPDFGALVDALKQLLQCFCLSKKDTAASSPRREAEPTATSTTRRNPSSPRRVTSSSPRGNTGLVAAVAKLLQAALGKRASDVSGLIQQAKRLFDEVGDGPFRARLTAFETLLYSESKLIAREGSTSTNAREAKLLVNHLKLLLSASARSPVVSPVTSPRGASPRVASPRDASSEEEDATPGAKLRRLYGWHFPELDALIPGDDRQYARVVLSMGDRGTWLEAPYTNGKALEEALGFPPSTVEQLVQLARGSMGSDITREELSEIRSLAQSIIR